MSTIAVLPYYKIQRELTSLAQEIVSSDRSMILYEDKIVTQYREFKITEVFDMSFRRMGNEGGFFYLHTSTGVYPYMVKIDPKPFIQKFRTITSKRLT
ncbi:hypothetical protein ASD24_04915 [Paenibacillus sp. Root52]|uniref:Uncharacterized protein n=1 Tax=Paenibacillus amylolyticus TaxID=1451 RepID=A0AAP5H1Y5_PAEAM|nr:MULTISPECIES: hypothetical protein [Paenibacillus]KQY94883.1 hypothetical protein ASD24_04915 [Paenibacillus sp. Root52]MCG7376591.1 hypothetical protein [Paenibacillus sp. ACRSA]MDR6723805.1 hypothetical protein [Paenibacillus amylolyticus]